MAKLTMKKIRLFALRKDRKQLMERLQRLGVLQIETVDRAEQGFAHEDMEAQAQGFERSAAVAGQALEVLQEELPEKKGLFASLSGRREVEMEAFAQVSVRSTEVLEDCQRVLALRRQQAEDAAELVRLRAARAQLEPWEALDIPVSFKGTRTTAAFIGTLPGTYSFVSLAEALAGADSELLFDGEVLSSSAEQTCVFLLAPRRQAETMETVLRGLGFSRPAGLAGRLPEVERAGLEKKREAVREAQRHTTQALCALAEKRRDMELVADYFTTRAEKYRAIGRLGHSRHTLLLEGYIPEADVPQLERELEAFGAAAWEVEEADPETAPVKLYNRAFARPAESLVEMYAMPLASDVDPTPVVSFFYYLFFGMMLSDAGYGLLLVVGASLLLHKCRPEPRMARNLELFRNCGISTIVWGLVFGSFFGNAPEIIASNFFHVNFTIPKLIDPIPDALLLLVLGVGLGFVQILAGLGIRFYMQWRLGDRWGAVFDTGFWMTALIGLATLAGGMAVPAIPWLSTAGAVVAIASFAGLVLTAGRKKKGPMKVLSGVASLYDITGYVSDLMSYSRLMALGLTTGVMAMVFNLLGSMFGDGPLGAVLFILVFAIGHTLNFGINVLGSYVHTLRLQYVELFSKFYEGGGRMFEPFAMRGRYVRIKPEKEGVR